MLTNPNFEIGAENATYGGKAYYHALAQAVEVLSPAAHNVLVCATSFPVGTPLSSRGLLRHSQFPAEAYIDEALNELHAKGYLRAEPTRAWLQLYLVPAGVEAAAPKPAKAKHPKTPKA